MCEKTKCKVLRNVGACGKEIQNNGIHGSGFCDTCWYPEIEEDYSLFMEYKKEGYSRLDAAITAGILTQFVNEDIKKSDVFFKKKKEIKQGDSYVIGQALEAEPINWRLNNVLEVEESEAEEAVV